MASPHELAALTYLSVFERGGPTDIATYLDGNRDYLTNVVNDLYHEGLLGKRSKGSYHITTEGRDVVLRESSLTSADLLAARLVESPLSDDAILGNGEEMVVRFANNAIVVYEVVFEEANNSDGVGPQLGFEASYADTAEGVRDRLSEAFEEF